MTFENAVPPDAIGPRSRIFKGVVKPAYRRIQVAASRSVDAALGLRTTSFLSAGSMPLEQQPDRPWGWLPLTRLFLRFPLRRSDLVVDVGSGRGRAALCAAVIFRCRGVVGVERDAGLHRIALENRRACRLPLRSRVDFVNADALSWPLPRETTAVFFFNSFRGSDFHRFVERLLGELEASKQTIRFFYANPVEAEFLATVPEFRFVGAIRSWRPESAWARTTSLYVYRVAASG